MNRRDWLKNTIAASSLRGLPPRASDSGVLALGALSPTEQKSEAEIYNLLGFATMTGESPPTMWARLRNTEQWLAGPLSPDSWSGQVFIADHRDIFACRFLSLPAAWTVNQASNDYAGFCAQHFSEWFKPWPAWWRTVGPKAPDDSYARLIWQMPDGGPQVTYEWARTGPNVIVGRIMHSRPADLLLQGYVPWDSHPPAFSVLYSESPDHRSLRGRSWIPGTRDGMRWVLALSEAVTTRHGTGTTKWNGIIPQVTSFYFCGKQGQKYELLEKETRAFIDPQRVDLLLAHNRKQYERDRPSGSGWLANIPPAINDQLQWSEVYTPERQRAYITVSRAWSRENNSAPDFLWDSFLSALLVCQEDERKSFALVRDITSWQSEGGMFLQYGQWPTHPENVIFPAAWGHTQYPIGSLAVAKIYLRRPNRDFLAEIYPRLLKAHRWWFSDRGDGQPWRDGNKNGLLELGSNYPNEIPYDDRQQVAYFESHDDSPEWWHIAPYNEETQTCELDTVERNCLYATDAWVLAWIARKLGIEQDAAELDREHAAMTERINRLLWNDENHCYFNRRWRPANGSWFNPQMAPDVFFSLLGKVAPRERYSALRDVFYDPRKFGGEWILPTISRDDPLYPKQHYWRGKVWGPINWLVYQGFKMHEWDHEARLLAESSAKMFLKSWREKGECHENFLSTTGEGSSDPHYTWGALMVLIAIEEYIDANPWHGLKFGTLEPVGEGAIRQYPVQNSLYDVVLSEREMEVERDGKLLFGADSPLEIRHVRFDKRLVTCEVRSKRPCSLRIGSGKKQNLAAGVTKLAGQL